MVSFEDSAHHGTGRIADFRGGFVRVSGPAETGSWLLCSQWESVTVARIDAALAFVSLVRATIQTCNQLAPLHIVRRVHAQRLDPRYCNDPLVRATWTKTSSMRDIFI
jgi:hypothetical protein